MNRTTIRGRIVLKGSGEAAMSRHWTRWALVGLVVVAAQGTRARAADWASSLFSEKGHDFGPVPRGAKVRHNFVLTNQLNETITVLDVHASCGCTSGRTSATTVPPGGRAIVEAEMDTRNFSGRKQTTLYVSVANTRGQQGEARLAVVSTILSDIVLNPGSLEFGVVSKGQTPKLALTIDRLGAPDWRAERMITTSTALAASLQEVSRSASGVSYILTVALRPEAPPGAIRDEIRILTNDRESPVVPVLVTGFVRGELTASPATLSLGNVIATSAAQGRYIVSGSKPFAITSIEGSGDGFTLSDSDARAKTIHILNLVYRPDQGKTRGDLRRAFRIHTDLNGEPPVELSASLHIEP
jgi:hypothetical protein